MLKVTIKKGKGEIEMPPIPAGLSGSITEDFKESSSIIVFTCKADDSGAIVHRMIDAESVKVGAVRSVQGDDMQVLADMECGESFELDVKKHYGTITLAFEHIRDSEGILH